MILSQLIKIDNRFEKSVNLLLDLNSDQKINSYIPSYYVKHQDQEISGFNIHFHLVKQVRTKPKWDDIHFHLVKQVRTKPKWDEQSLHFMKNSLQRVWQAEHPACPNIKACILCQL